MDPEDSHISEMAQAWVDREKAGFFGNVYNETDSNSAGHLFFHLENCEFAWRVILKIVFLISQDGDALVNTDLNVYLLELLGAGDFEDLFHENAGIFIDRTERIAKTDPLFAQMVKAMGRGSLDDLIWSRIQVLGN